MSGTRYATCGSVRSGPVTGLSGSKRRNSTLYGWARGFVTQTRVASTQLSFSWRSSVTTPTWSKLERSNWRALAIGWDAFYRRLRRNVKEGNAMRVLAVGAHPDDLEILCGGTLARFVREGHEVVMCHATLGDRGSYVHTSEEVAAIRGKEARRAAEICGAEHATLGLHDVEVDAADPAQRRLVIDLVRETRPDLILTHHPHDYMSDHNEIARLVFDCSFHATLPLLETDRPYHG